MTKIQRQHRRLDVHPLKPLAVAALSTVLAACSAPSALDSQAVERVNNKALPLISDRVAGESEKLLARQDVLLKELQKKTMPAPIEPVEPEYNPLDAVLVTIDVDNADARHVFKAIARQAGLNLLLSPELSEEGGERLTLRLERMPASQVFEHVLALLDFEGRIENNVLVVEKYRREVFNLNFLQTVTKADFQAGGDIFGSNTGGEEGSGGSGASSGVNGIQGNFSITGQNIGATDPYEQIEQMLKTVVNKTLSPSEGDLDPALESQLAEAGKGPGYTLNRNTGTLYVKGRPSQVETVSELVNRYKDVMNRQVLIEAQILDIELNDSYSYGVDWNTLDENVVSYFGQSALTNGAISTALPGATNPGRAITIPGATLGALGVPSLGLSYTHADVNIAVDLMKQFGNVHVLSNPSLRVKNAQPAVVSVGSTERYIVQTNSNVSQSGGGQVTTSSNVITGNIFDGVMLGVIPFVADDGEIHLTINPMQTKVEPGSTTPVDVGNENNPLKISLPKTDFKGITTSLSLRDGDVVILGGLISEDGGSGKQGVPGLADVPLLGHLFSNHNQLTNAREMVIVLRVHNL